MGPAIAAGKIRSVSDVGCGDRKLKRLMDEREWPICYQGFDLVPQNEDVHLLDLNLAPPPGSSDAVVVLGVSEYLDHVGASLARLTEHAPLLVVSHTVRDGDRFSEQAQQERGWKNHLSATEFEGLLAVNRWRIVDERSTSNRLTRLWLAERVGSSK
jgi:hypothetical protein